MGGVVEVIVFLSIIIEWKEIRSVGGKNQLFADLFFFGGVDGHRVQHIHRGMCALYKLATTYTTVRFSGS
jgi:hypothetical protein